MKINYTSETGDNWREIEGCDMQQISQSWNQKGRCGLYNMICRVDFYTPSEMKNSLNTNNLLNFSFCVD